MLSRAGFSLLVAPPDPPSSLPYSGLSTGRLISQHKVVSAFLALQLLVGLANWKAPTEDQRGGKKTGQELIHRVPPSQAWQLCFSTEEQSPFQGRDVKACTLG